MATAAIVTAIIGVTGATAAAIAMAVNFAVAFTAAYLMAKRAAGDSMPANDYKQMLKSDKNAQRVIYGKREVSMIMSFAEEQDGEQDEDEKLYLAGMICNHPVSSYTDVYLDDKVVGEYGGNASIYHVNGTGVIPSVLLNETSQYDSTMTGNNAYWMALKLNFDPEYFTQVPTPKVVVEGKRVKDLRDGVTKYSNNAALVIADFYMSYMGISEDRLIKSGSGSFLDAANLCDEVMEDGNIRYAINGMFELNQKPSDILNEMLKSCGGTLIRINGKIGLLPAAYYGNPTFTLTESDIVGSISIAPQESMSDATNVMGGSYVSIADGYSEQDFPPIRDEAQIIADGYEITEDITYSFVTSEFQAQRLANIELRRGIAGGFTEVTVSPKGAHCFVGRVIQMELPQLNISGEYRVTKLVENEDLTFTVTMQKDYVEIYDDSIGEPYSPPPTLELGGGGVAAPSGVQFVTVNNVGNVIQGALTWQGNSSSTNHFEVQVTNDSDDSLVQAGQTSALIYNLNALEIGNYTGSVRAVNHRGEKSGWATTTFSVGQPSAPTSVTVNNSNWNVELIPSILDGVTPQGTTFEFWYLADTASKTYDPPTYSAQDVVSAELISTGATLNKGSLSPDKWNHFWVRSINPYGVSGYIYVRTWTTADQDLVTTVVEQLQAVEIVSANWSDTGNGFSETGYKLFSPQSGAVTLPDGTHYPQGKADGLAVFQNAYVNGKIVVEEMTFVDPNAIPPEIDNGNVVSGSETYVQDNQPTDPSDGAVWYDTSNGSKPYVYNESIDTWVDVSETNFTGNLDISSSTPDGTMQINNDRISVYDGSGNLRVRIGRLN